ncbi:MAG: 3'(2'),5'-bisphosphate nucleotidase CysQ [Steroidobacteraceae bacterium]
MSGTRLLPPSELLTAVVDIARNAGNAILDVYGTDFGISAKADASPLTDADLRAHEIIVAGLAKLTPGMPVLSEESADICFAERAAWRRYWLVDPLDGTKEFISRNGEFTVNIALIEGHSPTLGVVHIPVSDTTYSGIPGTGAWRETSARPRAPIAVRRVRRPPLRVVGSRSHANPALAQALAALGPHELLPAGSSLKLCLVAEGTADLYPRLGPTSEWDIAAGQAVVEAAGGQVVRLSDGKALAYNTRAELLNPEFLAYGDPDCWRSWPRG